MSSDSSFSLVPSGPPLPPNGSAPLGPSSPDRKEPIRETGRGPTRGAATTATTAAAAGGAATTDPRGVPATVDERIDEAAMRTFLSEVTDTLTPHMMPEIVKNITDYVHYFPVDQILDIIRNPTPENLRQLPEVLGKMLGIEHPEKNEDYLRLPMQPSFPFLEGWILEGLEKHKEYKGKDKTARIANDLKLAFRQVLGDERIDKAAMRRFLSGVTAELTPHMEAVVVKIITDYVHYFPEDQILDILRNPTPENLERLPKVLEKILNKECVKLKNENRWTTDNPRFPIPQLFPLFEVLRKNFKVKDSTAKMANFIKLLFDALPPPHPNALPPPDNYLLESIQSEWVRHFLLRKANDEDLFGFIVDNIPSNRFFSFICCSLGSDKVPITCSFENFKKIIGKEYLNELALVVPYNEYKQYINELNIKLSSPRMSICIHLSGTENYRINQLVDCLNDILNQLIEGKKNKYRSITIVLNDSKNCAIIVYGWNAGCQIYGNLDRDVLNNLSRRFPDIQVLPYPFARTTPTNPVARTTPAIRGPVTTPTIRAPCDNRVLVCAAAVAALAAGWFWLQLKNIG